MKNFFAKIKEKFSSLKKKKDTDGSEASKPVTEDVSDDLSIDDVSLDDADTKTEDSGDKASENKSGKKEKAPLDKKKLIKGIAIATIVLALFFGGVYGVYQYVRDFPKVEAAGERFFSRLKKKTKSYNLMYMSMTKGFREKVSDKEFKFSIEGSSYLFENILKIEANEDKYVKKGKRFNLQGKVIYKDKTKGNFKLVLMKGKLKGKSTFLIDGFEVTSKANEKKVRKLAYRAMNEFLKVLSIKKLDSFKSSFHHTVAERMGKEANVRFAVMHSKHIEAGYTKHSYLEKDMEVKYNTQVTFKGTSKTKLGSTFDGRITLYYETGAWHVVGFSFKPQGS